MMVALVLLSISCASVSSATPARSDEAPFLMQLDREFNAATQARGIDGWISYFAPNGSQVRSDGTYAIGPEAIRGFWGPVLQGATVTWYPTESGITEGGRLGWTAGRYSYEAKGSTARSEGRYITVWKKMPDRSWKVLFDTGDDD